MSRIAVVSPAPIKGSGGIRTILSYAKSLSDAGHEVTVSFIADGQPLGADPSALIEQQYGISGLRAGEFPAGLENADLVVATRWDTPRAIRSHFGGKIVHLIQDIEGWFNPVGDGFLSAENNFLFDTNFITLGHWLAKKQQMDYGEASFTMDFGYDTHIYRHSTPYAQRSKRICFIYQPEKPRRCTQIGIEALGVVNAKRPDYEIVFYGNDQPAHLWYPVTNLGIVPPSALNQLYNDCRVGLCISASNPSRIPFEMTACGLPVVDIFRSNNLHDYDDTSGVLLAHQTPESLAKAMLEIIENEPVGRRMSQDALDFAAERSMAREMQQFTTYVEQILAGKTASPRQDMAPLYSARPIVAQSYTQDRVQAFCSRQRQEFLETTGAAPLPSTGGKGHRNVVPLNKMLDATVTCDLPSDLDWEPVSFPGGNTLQTHPLEDQITSVVIPAATPAHVKQLTAVARVANARAGTMEFAIALAPVQSDPDTQLQPDAAFWEGDQASGWVPVTAVADAELRLALERPSEAPMDLHLAVRAASGQKIAFGWCQWLMLSYLCAQPEEV